MIYVKYESGESIYFRERVERRNSIGSEEVLSKVCNRKGLSQRFWEFNGT